MKPLLILLLLIAINGCAQKKPVYNVEPAPVYNDSIPRVYIAGDNHEPPYRKDTVPTAPFFLGDSLPGHYIRFNTSPDTIRVVMLVTDTVHPPSYYYWKITTFHLYGYVIEPPINWTTTLPATISSTPPETIYLNSNKQPISKDWIVWMYKPVKP